ncbi:hypothetical protein ACFU7T_32830 [Streptomyces sp. NPDC057555]|uniref:hypothetical protein n=1 Tax=Streptomyces sp. NPDC057555 TaxID=3346166 RepID=UPI0036B0AFE8
MRTGCSFIPLQGRAGWAGYLDPAAYAVQRPDADAAVIRPLEVITSRLPGIV